MYVLLPKNFAWFLQFLSGLVSSFHSCSFICQLTHSLIPMYSNSYAMAVCVCEPLGEISCVLCYCGLLSYIREWWPRYSESSMLCAHSLRHPFIFVCIFCVFIPLYDYYYYTIDTIHIRRHNRLDCMHGCIYIMCTLMLALSLKPLCMVFEKRSCHVYIHIWTHTHTRTRKRTLAKAKKE